MKKEENKYFQLGNMVRIVVEGSSASSRQNSYGKVNYIIYKNSNGNLPICKIFDNLIHYQRRMYRRSNKKRILDFLNYLKTKFTEEELNLYPDYTAKDGRKHLKQKDDEMFTRGMLTCVMYNFINEMKEVGKDDK